MNWHYVERGQQNGPVSDEQLAELVRAGTINSETLVWFEGMANWLPYSQVKVESPGSPSNPPESAPANSANPLVMAKVKPLEAACNECGKIYPVDEMIRHGSAHICANCKPVFMQKLAEGAKLKTDDLEYASVINRFAAVFLDGMILWVFNIAIAFMLGLNAAQALGVQPRGAATLQIGLIFFQMAVGIGYEVFMIGKYGATLGKMALKIKVVTSDGGKVSYARALGRYFAKLLSAFTLMIGYIIAIFDDQKRALHDHICNTRVVTNSQ